MNICCFCLSRIAPSSSGRKYPTFLWGISSPSIPLRRHQFWVVLVELLLWAFCHRVITESQLGNQNVSSFGEATSPQKSIWHKAQAGTPAAIPLCFINSYERVRSFSLPLGSVNWDNVNLNFCGHSSHSILPPALVQHPSDAWNKLRWKSTLVWSMWILLKPLMETCLWSISPKFWSVQPHKVPNAFNFYICRILIFWYWEYLWGGERTSFMITIYMVPFDNRTRPLSPAQRFWQQVGESRLRRKHHTAGKWKWKYKPELWDRGSYHSDHNTTYQ